MFGNESRLAHGRIQVILQQFRQQPHENDSEPRSRSITSGSSHGADLSFLREYTAADLIVRPDYGEIMPPR
jgi:hypothetical protein